MNNSNSIKHHRVEVDGLGGKGMMGMERVRCARDEHFCQSSSGKLGNLVEGKGVGRGGRFCVFHRQLWV